MARVLSAIAGRRGAGRPGWVLSLAATAVVTAVIAGALTAIGIIHGPGTARSASLAHAPAVYVPDNASGTVTPIRVATNTALAPIKVGTEPQSIGFAPQSIGFASAGYRASGRQ